MGMEQPLVPRSTYIFTEAIEDDVLSLPGVRAVAKIAHPIFGFFIGVTGSVGENEDVLSLCLGARDIFFETWGPAPVGRIVHVPVRYPSEVPPQDLPPDAWGYLAFSIEDEFPSGPVYEATPVEIEPGAGGWVVLWAASCRQDLPEHAWLVTEFTYDEAERLDRVPATC